jgi:hypothetical protein
MRKNGLGKLYDRLTPKERFKLVMEAEIRGDKKESGQLVQSAPSYTYEQADPAYTDLVKASKDLTWAICLDLLPRLSDMRMARAFAEILPLACGAFAKDARDCYLRGRREGAERGWRAAGKAGALPEGEPNGEGSGAKEALERMSERMEWASEGYADLARKLELENAKGARVLWEAFSNFCREELGVEPNKLVKMWFEAALPEVEEFEARTQDVEIGREEVEKNEAAIEEGWRKLVEG